MNQGIMFLCKFGVLHVHGDMIQGGQMWFGEAIGLVGHQGRTMGFVVQPRRPVLVSTHALHPPVGIPNHDGRKDVVGRQIGHIGVRAMRLTKGFIAYGRVFAPDDLPPDSLLRGSVLRHARRHVTIGNEHFG